MIDFLILYEHKVREIESVCLLKAELENRNYTVDICLSHKINTWKYLYKKKPRVIVVIALRKNDDLRYQVYRIGGKIRKIVNLQWEQIFSEKDISIPEDYAAKAVHLCWGEGRKEQLKTYGIENAIVTGAIQMDFLSGKLKQYYDYNTGEKRISK